MQKGYCVAARSTKGEDIWVYYMVYYQEAEPSNTALLLLPTSPAPRTPLATKLLINLGHSLCSSLEQELILCTHSKK